MHRRFLIIAQARSGSTYLQSLLNAHPSIRCRGELFDLGQIDDDGDKIRDPARLAARDADPAGFLQRKLAGEGLGTEGLLSIGAKLLFHHNPRLFSEILPSAPDISLIHVSRSNKLAQFASARQVEKTGRWVASGGDGPPPRIAPAPKWALAECNRLANEDLFLGHWIAALPNPSLRVAYTDLFAPGIADRLTSFLGLPSVGPLAGALRKQGQNRILDRFENPGPMRATFEAAGLGAWLGPELP